MSIFEPETLPLSSELREQAIERRLAALGREVAVHVVEPLGNVLGERFNQRLVEPVAGRPGYQELIRGDDPSPGSSWQYLVPGEQVVWPLSVFCELTTSAVAGLRSVTVEYLDADGVRYLVAGSQAQLSSGQSQAFCWHPLAGDVAWPVSDAAIAPLPQQMLYPAHSLSIRLGGAQAGDQLASVRLSAYLYPTGP